VRHQWALAAAIVALSGCAMLDTGKPPPAVPAQGAVLPSGPLILGDYEKDSAASLRSSFAKTIASRYAPGAPISAATKDLESNRFACAAPKQGAGDPPDQVCRRTIKAGGCTYTYQVHLFNDPGKAGVSRVRGLFDKACGDELLGG
jgi:hypothetical protein